MFKHYNNKLRVTSLILVGLSLLVLAACGDNIVASPTVLPQAALADQPTSTATPVATATATPVTALQPCTSTALAGSATWGYILVPPGEVPELIGRVTVTNQSSTACTVFGAPQIQITDQQGQAAILLPLPADVKRNYHDPATTVTLQPGQSAWATFQVISSCRQEPTAQGHVAFNVGLPNNGGQLAFQVTGFSTLVHVCSNPTDIYIAIDPFEFVVATPMQTATARSRTVGAIITGNAQATAFLVQQATELAAVPTSTAIPTLPPNTLPCQAADLTAAYVESTQYSPFSDNSWILVTNKGSKVCTLKGYPGVLLLDDQGQPTSVNIKYEHQYKDPQTGELEGETLDKDMGDSPIIGLAPGGKALTEITWYRCSTSGVVEDPANNASGKTTVAFVLSQNQGQLTVTSAIGWLPRCKGGTNLVLYNFAYGNDYKPFYGYTPTPIPPTATPIPPTAMRGPLPTNPPFNTPTPGDPPPTASCNCPPGQTCIQLVCTTLAVRPPLEAVIRKDEQH